MIASVSTLARSSGATIPRWMVSFSMEAAPYFADRWSFSPARSMSRPMPSTVLQAAIPQRKAIRSRPWTIFFMVTRSGRKSADVDEVPGDTGGGRHRGADQVRAAARALPSLEVPVRGRGAALARLEPVGVHGEAHRAARLAPFEAGCEEDLVQPLGLRLRLHQAGPRHHHGELHVVGPALAAHHGRGLPQVLDA